MASGSSAESFPNVHNTISDILQTITHLQRAQLSLNEEVAELKKLLTTAHLTRKVSSEARHLDAGRRLTGTTELLEKILVHLPSHTLLFAQRVNRQFRRIITHNNDLQQKLFLIPTPTSGAITLNDMVSSPWVLRRLPLYLDIKVLRLAYIPGDARIRLFGEIIQMSKQQGILIRLTDQHDARWFGHLPPTLGAGSWKSMSISQPICEVRWSIDVVKHCSSHDEVHLYWCTTPGADSFDTLLDVMAETPLQHITQSKWEYDQDRGRNAMAETRFEEQFLE